MGPVLGPLATGGRACGHCLCAQPVVAPHVSPPVVEGPRGEPWRREKVAPDCRPRQVQSQVCSFGGRSCGGPVA